jgi:RNA-binding protein
MPIHSKIKQQLKAKAHKLKPIVLIGNKGLTEAVHKEIDQALRDHELIKIRVSTIDRDVRHQLFAEICLVNQAELIHIIGNIGIIYRINTKES